MSFNYFDILQIILVGGILYLGYFFAKEKMYKSVGALILLVLVYTFTSPVILETPSNSRFTTSPQTIPEKVIVEEKTFEEKQAEKFEKLKQESKLTEGNINE